jgi:His/Glu/Gln/Arg/opine family amino acid ABC transporter permease subunit
VSDRHFAHVHGDDPSIRERFIDGFELPEAVDIAEAIAFACTRPRQYRPHGDHTDASGDWRLSDRQAGNAARSAVLQRTEAVTRFDLSAILANPEFIAMLLHGIEMTFIIAIGSWILAMTLAILLLALHFAPGRFGNAFVAGYVSYQRNVPTLVQLMLWYFSIFTLLPYWLTHWLASHNVEAIFAIIGLGLCRAAYFSEDLRSGLRSVSPPSPRSAFSRRSAALIPRITKGEQR